MSDYTDKAYDDLLADAAWPSGDPRKKVDGVLLTANSARADLTISPVPSPEVITAEKASWPTAKKRAIANSISIHRQLKEHYAQEPDDIAAGTVYRVETIKTKVDQATGSGGFIRIAAFLPKTAGVAAENGKEKVPF